MLTSQVGYLNSELSARVQFCKLDAHSLSLFIVLYQTYISLLNLDSFNVTSQVYNIIIKAPYNNLLSVYLKSISQFYDFDYHYPLIWQHILNRSLE